MNPDTRGDIERHLKDRLFSFSSVTTMDYNDHVFIFARATGTSQPHLCSIPNICAGFLCLLLYVCFLLDLFLCFSISQILVANLLSLQLTPGFTPRRGLVLFSPVPSFLAPAALPSCLSTAHLGQYHTEIVTQKTGQRRDPLDLISYLTLTFKG